MGLSISRAPLGGSINRPTVWQRRLDLYGQERHDGRIPLIRCACSTRMVAGATAILGKYSKTDRGQVPAYVGILEVPEENWGMYGQQVHLAAMQVKA